MVDGKDTSKTSSLDKALSGSTQDEQILNLILANKQESENYKKSSRILDDQKEWHDLYRSIPEDRPYNWMSNKFIPAISSKVDTGVANIMDMVFQKKRPIDVQPRSFGNGDDKHAGYWKTLLSKQMYTDNMFYKFLNFVKNILIYGTAFAKVFWSYSLRKIFVKKKQYNSIMGMFGKIFRKPAGYTEQPEIVEVEDGPTFDVINMGDLFWDPQSIEIGDSWVEHRSLKSISYLKSMMKTQDNPYGIYNNNVNYLNQGDSTEFKEGKEEIESSEGRQQDARVSRPADSYRVEVLEWVGDYKLNDKLTRCILTVAAGKYVIGKREFPFWLTEPSNYVKGVYISMPNEFPGIGLPELLSDLQYNLNETVNQRVDNISLTLNPMAIYLANSGVNTTNLIAKPGGIYREEEPNSIRWDRAPDVTSSNFAHTQEIERWMQEVSAITKITLGTAGSDVNRTATGMSILEKSAADRFLITAKIIEHTAFNKFVRMFAEMDYQFYDEFKIGTIIGVDPSEIDMDKMRPDYYDFSPAGVKTIEDKNQKALKLLQLMNMAKDMPDFDTRKAIRKFIALLDIDDDPEELLRTPEQADALRQAQMVQKLMEMTAQGKMGAGGAGGAGSESTQFTGDSQISTPGTPPLSGMTSPAPEQVIEK